ncbi:MAG: hypothetical protein RQ847_11605 [Wenzhouxiangellaceae bacterium]|nr:hypothetical protein [Wenzhouxiangellaceae bacterium]
MRSIALVVTLLALSLQFAAAQVLPPAEGYTVDVTFSKGLERRMASINNLEQNFEEQFRQSRQDRQSFPTTGTQRFSETETSGTEWAGDRLIGDPSAFTLENLVKAMAAYNVNRAAPDFRGRVEFDIRELKLTNSPIASLESFQSYAAGRVKVTDAAGNVVYDGKVRANLVRQPTVDRSYSGPELAFLETDPTKRVGPVLANFVERSLERVWPDRKEEIAGPVIIRVSEPNERVVIN